jgi:hypothetical protein
MSGWYKRRCCFSIPLILSIIRYDEETGHLYWIKKRRGRRMGVPAGTLTPSGHRVISFHLFTARAEEIVWAIKTGREYFGPIRHLTGDKDDNRFENLYEDDAKLWPPLKGRVEREIDLY